VQPGEELQGVAPVDLVGKERLVDELEREPRVERRLALEMARLELERLATVQL
jgi:hypothetical protein